jgi:hypothetical protein
MKILINTIYSILIGIVISFPVFVSAQDSIRYTYHGLGIGSFSNAKLEEFSLPQDTFQVLNTMNWYSRSMGYQFEWKGTEKFSWSLGADALRGGSSVLNEDSAVFNTELKGYYVWLRFRYYYYQGDRFQFYSGLGGGYSHIKGKQMRIASSGITSDYLFENSLSRMMAEIIGTRMRIGKNFGLQLSLNLSPIPFRMGLTYRVPYVSHKPKSFKKVSKTEDSVLSHPKSSRQVGILLGRMYENASGFSPTSLNLLYDQFIDDNIAIGFFFHYSNGIYFMDDFLSLENGGGEGKLLKYKYSPNQLTNLQFSMRFSKYVPIGKKWMFLYGGGAGLRARLLPGFQATSSGAGLMPIALNGYYGFQGKISPSGSIFLTSGLIPNLFQIGLSFNL